MKLSEAIRLGAMMRPQVRQATLTRHGSCALGAAAEAIGVQVPAPLDKIAEKLNETFPMLRVMVDFPSVPGPIELQWVIIKLNDYYNWSREQIADYVATIEERSGLCEIAPSAIEPCDTVRKEHHYQAREAVPTL